jgi:predicted RNA-binding Zn ribbon-like protein
VELGIRVSDARADEDFLLALLNTTPVVDGVAVDDLADLESARPWLVSVGGTATERELRHLRRVRASLQGVVRGELDPSVLAPVIRGVTLAATMAAGLEWRLDVAAERELAVRAVLAWDSLRRLRPGRLRPCGNDECRLFLLDRSKSNRARWCSMAVCGNRMKARRHYERIRRTAAVD